jgi:hypothetical protein
MKNNFKITSCALILLICVMLAGCVSERKRAKICATCPIKEIRTDSTIYKEYWSFRDSILNVPKDSAQIEYVVSPCPDGSIPAIKETYKKDGRKTKLTGRVVGPKITVAANVGSEQLKFELREKTRELERIKSEAKTLPCVERWGADLFYYSGIGAYVLSFLSLVLAVIYRSIKHGDKK